MRYTEFKYMEQEDDCGTESHSNGSSSDIREKRESGYHCSGDAGIERLEGGNILNMSVEKKWHRWIAIAVALLMLVTLAMPMNVSKASAATTNLQNPRTASDGIVTWDCVWFGHYPQSSDGNGGFNNDPIKWRVLSVDGDEALLLADKNLEKDLMYNTDEGGGVWSRSIIRSWLNGYGSDYNSAKENFTQKNFIDVAFNEQEKNAIYEKKIMNNAGPHTTDKVFLLSVTEAKNSTYGLPDTQQNTPTRISKDTDYVNWKIGDTANNDTWWLRSYGSVEEASGAVYVTKNGFIAEGGTYVAMCDIGVRPALRLNLTSNLWSYAGAVSSDGTIDETPLQQQKPTTPVARNSQTITAKSVIKTYGNKPFNLNAKAKTKLSYKSSNPRVATVSTIGRVTLKGLGKATITITAAATSQYNAATKRITITVKPKKTVGVKVKKGKKNITISKNKTVKRIIKKLKARKTYYVKVRAYKKVGKTKIYGDYSKVKKVKVR